MAYQIQLISAGRASCTKDWYIAPLVGVNRIWYIHEGSVSLALSEKTVTLRAGRLYLIAQTLPLRLLLDEQTHVDHTYFDFFSLPALVMDEVLEIDPSENSAIAAAMMPLTFFAKDEKHREATCAYIDAFLSVVEKELGLGTLKNETIAEAIRYIHAHFCEPISVEELAKRAHLEKSVFIRKFKHKARTTPYQYLKNLRVSVALAMMRTGRYSLLQIAERTGYCDASALSHAVKSVYGKYAGQIK